MIKYFIKKGARSFGKDRVYFSGLPATHIAILTRRNSHTMSDIEALSALGCKLQEVDESQYFSPLASPERVTGASNLPAGYKED